MQWDLGYQGAALLGAIALAFGVVAAAVVGGGRTRRLWAAGVATVACVVTGLLTSEVLFGWATEEDLQPNVDGLSRDEVLLSSLLTTLLVVVAVRHVVPGSARRRPRDRRAHARHGRHRAA